MGSRMMDARMDEQHMDKLRSLILVENMDQDFDIMNTILNYFQYIYRNVFFDLTQ
jgi:hypothetical protein